MYFAHVVESHHGANALGPNAACAKPAAFASSAVLFFFRRARGGPKRRRSVPGTATLRNRSFPPFKPPKQAPSRGHTRPSCPYQRRAFFTTAPGDMGADPLGDNSSDMIPNRDYPE